jgi:hypothetical protein
VVVVVSVGQVRFGRSKLSDPAKAGAKETRRAAAARGSVFMSVSFLSISEPFGLVLLHPV